MLYGTSSTLRWPDDEQGPWRLTFFWAAVEGRLDLVGLDIRGFDGDKPQPDDLDSLPRLSALTLRQLPLRRLADQSWQSSRTLEQLLAQQSSEPDQAMRVLEALRPPRSQRKGGRPVELQPEHFVEVARIYRAALLRREHPTDAVRRKLGISRSTAGKRVARARSLGLLDPVSKQGTRAEGLAPEETPKKTTKSKSGKR